MFTRITSSTIYGLDAIPIFIEIDLDKGLSSFSIIGLGDKAIQEARERIQSAIKNSGFSLPRGKITVNLAPADIEKKGSSFDMAIAVGILHAADKIKINLEKQFFIGELSLDGSFRSSSGILASTILARNLAYSEIFIPKENLGEASLIDGINIYGIANLAELCNYLNGRIKLVNEAQKISIEPEQKQYIDFKNIKAQYKAKRALEIAAAGAHNLIMVGTPGSGKSLLAKAFPSILPNLSESESIEVTKIYSSVGMLSRNNSLIKIRPFRSPHHSSSLVSIIGGGKSPKPGEITLAHRGVLFLDEFSEFSSKTIESLRQPIEDRIVTVSRASYTHIFPANFILLAAMNPCKCGFAGSKKRECICSQREILNYQKKISGPILDRIDLKVNASDVNIYDFAKEDKTECSMIVRKRVENARLIQIKRLEKYSKITNSDIDERLIDEICNIDSISRDLLNNAANKLKMSPRSYIKTIKLARTIADLAAIENIKREHIAEALSFRIDGFY